MPGAQVTVSSDAWRAEARSDGQGRFAVTVPTADDARVVVSAAGFAQATEQVPRAEMGRRRTIVLRIASVEARISVTATRSAVRLGDTPAAIAIVGRDPIETAASPALDDALRQVPGFTLFRRTGSRTANPTSQGVSLRGLGASGASRALVLDDGVPLNDPFGGWVFWDRVPATVIERVEVMQGGGSDMYGSDALGGVVNLLRTTRGQPGFDVDASVGSLRSRKAAIDGGGAIGVRAGLPVFRNAQQRDAASAQRHANRTAVGRRAMARGGVGARRQHDVVCRSRGTATHNGDIRGRHDDADPAHLDKRGCAVRSLDQRRMVPGNVALVGRLVPQQPKQGATVGIQFSHPRIATVAVQARWVGEQFDDDLNQFALAPYGAIDAFVSRHVTRAAEVFVTGENLTNRQYEVGKTPVTTVGWPRSVRVGFRIRVGR